MKSIYLILALIFSYSGAAQDSRLFENTWYLRELFLEDIHFIPPTNNEIEFVSLRFYEPNSMETAACYSMTASVDFIGADQFSLFDGGMTLQGCENPENIDFADAYMIQFFWDHFDYAFEYSLSVEGDRKTLMISNSWNSVAIYRNTMLSTQDINDLQFVIYPNPTDGILNFESETPIEKVIVYDFLGRNVLGASPITRTIQMDLSSLKSGVYIAEIFSEGKRSHRKIVKSR